VSEIRHISYRLLSAVALRIALFHCRFGSKHLLFSGGSKTIQVSTLQSIKKGYNLAMHSRFTRRQFIAGAVATGAALSVPWYFDTGTAFAFYQSQGLKKFIQPLRGVGPGGIPVAATDGSAPVTGVTHYSFTIGQFTDQLHPSLGPTTLWGYNPAVALGGGTQPQKHLGGIIVANRGTPIQLTFTNKLPSKHILPVDTSANFPDAQKRQNAAATHLHGGFVPWISDGGPFAWFTPDGQYGPSVQSSAGNIYKLLNPGLQPGQAEHYYPNDQSARLVWYHDHAHDLTRLNAYAGVASAYIIRDSFEANLRNQGLPDFIENGGREIPIVIQDKIFVGSDILTKDPTWPGPTGVGSLWYPHTYETKRWKLGGGHPSGLPPDPSIIPEMFGDTMLANGTVYPEATVEARRYRLRILNACQARFLNLQLYVDDGSPDGITLTSNTFVPTNAKGPDFLVLGTEGGFLPHPVQVASNKPFDPTTLSGSLITGLAERWDLLVDFSGFAGQKVILYNDAPAPFPGGFKPNDYFPSAPGNDTQPQPGFGPNTRQILRFKVVPATSQDPPLTITTSTDLTPDLTKFIVPPGTAVQNGVLNLPPGVPVRQLTLNETFDGFGRLIQLLGTNVAVNGGFGRAYEDAATETPKAGSQEVWQIANLTKDTHPIHFHLVNVQVLGRQPFNAKTYTGTPSYTGPAHGPDDTELGWKETVRMNPGEVTTVIMEFDLPTVPFTVPSSPRTGGNEYVWHCHILEHEEHDMMRPLIVM
jgi:spore coat protein A